MFAIAVHEAIIAARGKVKMTIDRFFVLLRAVTSLPLIIIT
jgi:hypothetical protein